MQPKMYFIKNFVKLRPLIYNLIITGIIIFVLSNSITSYLYLKNMNKDSTFHAEQNQIYREFENIKEDWKYVSSKIGVENNLIHTNKTNHKFYRDVYTDKTAEIIYNLYEEDIKLFNYKF